MTTETQPLIDTLLRKFAAGDPGLMGLIASDIDFAIEHYRDDADTSWQRAHGIEGFGAVLTRLGSDIFPQGTRIITLESRALGDGWHHTRFEQEFFYGLRGCMVRSVTFILSHEAGGKLDFFREVVTDTREV